jgi:hypothetical protein
VGLHGKCFLTARLYWHNLKKCCNIVDRICSEVLDMIDTRMRLSGAWKWLSKIIK